MKQCLLFLICALTIINVNGQRRNRGDFKMVSHITVDWYMPDGKKWNEMSRDIRYHYDDNDKLIGIDDQDGPPTVVTYKYRFHDRRRVVALPYKNDRLIKNPDSLVLILEYPFQCIHEYNVVNDETGDVAYTNLKIQTLYSKGNIYIVMVDDYWKEEIAPGDVNAMKSIASQRIDEIVKSDYKNQKLISYDYLPVEEGHQFTSTGEMYWRDCNRHPIHRAFYFDKGDIQHGIWYNKDSNLRSGNRGDYFEDIEYTDIVNDTNVEFSGLVYVFYPDCWFYSPEFSSEWLGLQSKHLPKYTGRKYKGGHYYMEYCRKEKPDYYVKRWGNPKLECDIEWNYTFDDKNNLVQIEATTYCWGRNRCVINIEYVK